MFDIRESVEQVIELMKDKAIMKKIDIETEFLGFESHFVKLDDKTVSVNLVKSD